jgi:hypothetical protein
MGKSASQTAYLQIKQDEVKSNFTKELFLADSQIDYL